MLVAGTVVDERALARRVLDVALAPPPRRSPPPSARRSSSTFSAVRPSPPARARSAPRARRRSSAELRRRRDRQSWPARPGERLELVDLAARQQRGVHLEVRVLGGRADQRAGALFHGRQQGILLCLVEAVDLVEKEDRAPAVPRRAGRARLRSRPAPRQRSRSRRTAARTRRRCSPRRCGRALSCRCREARRGSASPRGRQRSRGVAPSLLRGSAAGRPARREPWAARGRRAEPARTSGWTRPPRTGRPWAKVCSTPWRIPCARRLSGCSKSYSRQHRQPARERDGGGRTAARVPRGKRHRV